MPMNPETVLSFWFGDFADSPEALGKRIAFWFGKSDATDALIRERFGSALEAASCGELDRLADTARGRLALLILLDQFSRNVHRGTPQAFENDPRALALALDGIDKGLDRELHLVERVFFYLPLEHAEDLAMQDRSVALFQRLLDEAPAELKGYFASFVDYAERHRDIIARFGRFPHRNAVLGRESTAEELAYLAQPGSGF